MENRFSESQVQLILMNFAKDNNISSNGIRIRKWLTEHIANLPVMRCVFAVGDTIRYNETQRSWRETFVGGKKIETITRIEEVGDDIYLWLSNGHYTNPECVEKT